MDSIMWLFTVPVLKIAIQVAIFLAAIFLIVQIIRWSIQSKPLNPFKTDSRVARKLYIHDQKKRDVVIKQSFSKDKIPEHLDAIIIGSGIGGLTTAAILAKTGKKVLVLEQHDQAGGCCHTFIDKGYEFDVGIHYVGEIGVQSINKTLLDQVSDGQIEWAPLDETYDIVRIGYDDESRDYPLTKGFNAWKALLNKQFPEEKSAIDKFFKLLDGTEGIDLFYGALKLLPMWVVRLVLASGILRVLPISLMNTEYTKSTLDLVTSLTKNKDLQTVMMYSWGDYGTLPSGSNFTLIAEVHKHFLKAGGFYPVGGASEIAYNMIPVIERAGGRVLVRANVSQIIAQKGKVCGVEVAKGSGDKIEVYAPLVVSSAGVYNTFQSLLPQEIASKSYFSDICKELKPGLAAMNVFLGLNMSNEELGVKKQNMWAFTKNTITQESQTYLNLDVETVMDSEIPQLFISFPSTKDPEWANHPGREGKSTCAIVTIVNWDWFKSWQDKPLKKRGDDYTEVKNTIGEQMIEQVCKIFPQIRDNIDFKEIGSPVTNKTYIAQPHGEIYGLDHSMERFDPFMMAKLRPETDVPGLYLTGQDILTCGFTGGLFSGVITSQAILGRNVMGDLETLQASLEKDDLTKSSLNTTLKKGN